MCFTRECLIIKRNCHVGKLLSANANIPNDNIPGQQYKKGFPHVTQVINTIPITTLSAKDGHSHVSIPSHTAYNQFGYPHQIQQYKPELFTKNVSYNSNSENATPKTVLAYSYNRHSQNVDKFENFDFSANSMNVDLTNYSDGEQKEFGVCHHQQRECDENFDSSMETDNENNPMRIT